MGNDEKRDEVMERWEYASCKADDIDRLDKAGKNGWEIVSVTCATQIDYAPTYIAWFKREIK